MNGIRCVCTNDSDKPSIIPENLWIKKGTEYHIVHVFKHLSQKGISGVELAEVNISHCKPYNSFGLNRFAINIDDFQKLKELISDCTELSDIDVSSLVENLELIENYEL